MLFGKIVSLPGPIQSGFMGPLKELQQKWLWKNLQLNWSIHLIMPSSTIAITGTILPAFDFPLESEDHLHDQY